MDLTEYRKDLIFRYHRIAGKRHSDKEKERFIRSLLIDLGKNNNEVHVIETKNQNSKNVISRNIYVGDVKKADQIFATYYDTPTAHLGPYYIFNKELQEKNSLYFNLFVGLFIIGVGLLFTILYTVPQLSSNLMTMFEIILLVVFYFIFFIFLRKFAMGWPIKSNLIRNTSSIIWMLEKISENKDKTIAFAFLDNGTTNEHGLASLLKSVKANSKIFYFDSIGAEKNLYVNKNNQVESFTSQKFDDYGLYKIAPGIISNHELILMKSDLKENQLSENNFKQISDFFK
ncbi:hypothetical protein EF384_01890 [Aerococcus agrisoli]|uniref:Uncharacterized protein n=1 Tax=Aerococcus agrisoli TaxID=2487350 RepID=A0A3N4GLB8_9LACT|nr:hypothetical protein [Aerococcus agrisoli]RPA63693.1 hypothetical protein EF384_01890 [Aerococcus agrisoli]